ncbi:MAG: hypothetical protein ABSB57_04770 [Dehalococcoidia bacterium]
MKRFLGRSAGSSRWRLAVAVGVVVALLAVGIALAAYFASRGSDGSSVAQKTQESATAVLQPEGDAVDRAKQATEADKAKPRFRGELGDFVIVEPNTTNHYPCPEPAQFATNLERSELYFSLPGAVIDAEGAASCQGTIFSITAFVPDASGEAMVGRGYFVAPRLELNADAPEERLKLITVGGKPALAELPIPDCMVCDSQVVVIERFPSEAAPGVFTWVRTINDLDKAIALAEQIMGVRQ